MRSFSCFNISTSTREWKLQFLSLSLFLLPSSTCVTHTSLLCSLYICFPPSLSLTLSLTNYLSSKLPPPPLSHSLIPTPFLIHRPSFYMSLYLFILLSLSLCLPLSLSISLSLSRSLSHFRCERVSLSGMTFKTKDSKFKNLNFCIWRRWVLAGFKPMTSKSCGMYLTIVQLSYCYNCDF